MPKLNIRLKAQSIKAKYRQIADQISVFITSGKLKDGERLPSDRALAEQLGVSRNTVKDAYRLLKDEKLISTIGTLGTIVGGAKNNPSSKKSAGKASAPQKRAQKKR